MKVSLNTVKQYIDIDLPAVDELVARINQQLGGVEEVIDLGAVYKDAKIVKVVECGKHPDADKLSLCQIDAGTGELVQVVCGADNVKAGMWAVWLPPGSTVPSTYNDDEPFVLGARELRGKMSNGMLASARELALGDNHDGIVEITESDLPPAARHPELDSGSSNDERTLDQVQNDSGMKPGASFAEVFSLDDTIIDIENKMFTHRPDLFGQLGVAREISAILHGPSDGKEGEDTRFVNPDWYWSMPEFVSGNDSLSLEVFNDAPEGSPRFMAVAVDGVEVKPSPLWLQCELVRWGSKSINNIVDWTNYIMLLTAQPVHAYDYDKIRGAKIGTRMANKGEKVTLLNGKTYQLTPDDIVIADGEGAIGLAGIMGGGNSEVSSDTKRIVLEVANFDMYTVRKTSMRHGLFTDALTRFNKGQSPLQNNRVMKYLIDLIGGEQASPVFDLPTTHQGQDSVHGEVLVSAEFINQRLGLDLSESQISSLLRRVNMAVLASESDSTQLSVTAPYWRTDIELPEDVVEEVGRLYGFDKLPRELPLRTIRPASSNSLHVVKQSIRDSLSRAGANEVLTYSFVHENILKRAGQDAAQAFKLSNALSPDLQYYRLTVLPSLLDKVHANIKSGHHEFVLFEIGKGHNKKYHANDDEGLPSESQFIDAVYASNKAQPGAAYFRMRRLLDQLASDHHLSFVYTPADESMDYPVTAPFDLRRSATVKTVDGVFVGLVGELKQSVVSNFKLPQYSSAMTLDLQSLSAAITDTSGNYQPLSRYPSVWQDLSLRVAGDVTYSDLMQTVTAAVEAKADDAKIIIEPTTIYQPEDDSSHKTITYRITATSHSRTLTDDDLRVMLDHAVDQASSSHKASVV